MRRNQKPILEEMRGNLDQKSFRNMRENFRDICGKCGGIRSRFEKKAKKVWRTQKFARKFERYLRLIWGNLKPIWRKCEKAWEKFEEPFWNTIWEIFEGNIEEFEPDLEKVRGKFGELFNNMRGNTKNIFQKLEKSEVSLGEVRKKLEGNLTALWEVCEKIWEIFAENMEEFRPIWKKCEEIWEIFARNLKLIGRKCEKRLREICGTFLKRNSNKIYQ